MGLRRSPPDPNGEFFPVGALGNRPCRGWPRVFSRQTTSALCWSSDQRPQLHLGGAVRPGMRVQRRVEKSHRRFIAHVCGSSLFIELSDNSCPGEDMGSAQSSDNIAPCAWVLRCTHTIRRCMRIRLVSWNGPIAQHLRRLPSPCRALLRLIRK